MNISNKLILLRDQYKFSQQEVADSIGVSKSTYCRYEKGTASPGIEEINNILALYNITYEEFVKISLPLEHTIAYPEKLLKILKETIEKNSCPTHDYHENYDKYCHIKDAMEPILAIRDEAMDFPNIDLSTIQAGTTVKVVRLDMRGEKLIEEGLNARQALFDAMQSAKSDIKKGGG